MLPVYSVSQFVEQVNGIIAGVFTVEGEVSGYKVSQGKWVFFDLKDEKASVNCFATIFGLGIPLADGMRIKVTGYPKIYEKSGRFSLVAQKAEAVGEGSLQKAYLLLKQKLSAEGLFSSERKRAIHDIPSRIGVIASRDSAAWGDFWRILNNRWNGVEVLLYHCAVQGEDAPGEIVNAFKYFNELSKDEQPDVLVIIRGGGSLEDLSAFNSEAVVRAIYGSIIPVVCGVGHERDESLADLAADRRASTPSNAAEIVVPDKEEFVSSLELTVDHIGSELRNVIAIKRRMVEQYLYLVSSRLESPLRAASILVDRFQAIPGQLASAVSLRQAIVLGAERLLANVDPKRVLARGYSITRNTAGRIVKSSREIVVGEKIVVELSQGKLTGKVL